MGPISPLQRPVLPHCGALRGGELQVSESGSGWWVGAVGGMLPHHQALVQQTLKGFLPETRPCLCPGDLEADQHIPGGV